MQKATGNNLFGIDVSEFQGDFDFQQMIDENGLEFVIIRTTVEAEGGGTSVDTKFQTNAQNARAVGLPAGGYHFARPTSSLTDAETQADAFATELQNGFGVGDFGDIFPVLDFEDLEGKDGTISITDALDWMEHFKDYFFDTYGRKVMLYTGRDFINDNNNFNLDTTGNPLLDMPLWVAGWTRFGYEESVPDAGGWTQWQAWQYTDNGALDAITETFTGETIGTGDGATTVFFFNLAPIRRFTYTVYVDGIEQEEGTDYDITNFGAGEITFTSPPANTADITADWQAEAVDFNHGRTSIDFFLRPTAPENLSVTSSQGGRFLTWDVVDIDDLTAYNIYVDSVYTDTVFTNQYQLPNDVDGESYTVTAVDFYEESEQSSALVVSSELPNIDQCVWGYRIEVDNPPPLTFTRASSAYDNNGVVYGSDQPRFESGQAGFDDAILLEDMTTNRIPSGQGFLISDGGGGIASGWSSYSLGAGAGTHSMISSNTTFGQPLTQEIIYNAGTGGAGDRFGIQKTITGISTPSTVSVLIDVISLTGASDVTINVDYYNGGGYVNTQATTLSSTTTGYERFTLNPETNTIDEARIFIWIANDDGEINVQIVQEENYQIGTTFIEGTREDDMLSGDPAELLTFDGGTEEGTVSFWFYHSDQTRNAQLTTFYLSHGTNAPTNENEFSILFHKASAQFRVQTGNNAGTGTLLTTGDIADGWHQIHVTYNVSTTTIKLYIDGALQASSATANLPTVLNSEMFIANYFSGVESRQFNNLLDNLVFTDNEKDATTIGNEYASGAPVPADSNTLAVYNFNSDLTSGGWGQWTGTNTALTNATNVLSSFVHWVDVVYDGSITIESSIDNGSNWDVCTKGGSIPNVSGDMSSDSMRLRATLESEKGNFPKLINLYYNITYGATLGGGQTFPMEFDTVSSFEIRGSDVEQVVYNDSNVSIPWVAKIYGEIINFEIQNLTTGKNLKMDSTVSAGEIMTIDTRFGQKSITKDGVNKVSELDISESEFWQLVPGENLIRFESSTNNNGAVIFTYREEKAGF